MEKRSTIYTFLGRKGKIIYQSSYILINPYGHKGSEFAPIVIHVHFILCILYRRESKKTSQSIIIIIILTFIYNRVSSFDHE